MIYTPITKIALKLCFEIHKDQRDKSGMPYVFHPFHLAESMTDEYTTTVALLHDTVEDSDMTIERLGELGIPKVCLDAIDLLTHREVVPYFDYVRAIAKNPIAKAVKIADLKHNSDLTRFDTAPDEYAMKRQEKYLTALKILSEEI
jgi:(p)ppGpp synthase/HD superfamily hydrolase